jgi:hypothetical protein
MTDITQEDALRLADALVGQALKETETRCAVLAEFIYNCDQAGARTAAWSGALRELRALQDHRSGLTRRHTLIQQALDCPLGDSPSTAPLQAPPKTTAPRTQQQLQVRARRRSRPDS